MKVLRLSLICFSILLINSKVFAQSYTTGHEDKKGEVNFTELANYLLDHPVPFARKPVIEEEEDEYDRPIPATPDPSLVHMIHRSAAKEVAPSGTSMMVMSPTTIDTFLSINTNGTSIPPDTHGAVDSNYCVTAINTVVRIQKKAGVGTHASVSTVDLDAFWNSVIPSGTTAFDPRVHYDPYNNRWILVTFAVSGTMTKSTIMIAVSKTSNPTGAWSMFTVTTDATNKSWLDYPNVGFNKQWVTVTGNFFKNSSGGATGGVLYVFDYSKLLAGTGAPYTKISKSSSFTLCPALTYDPGTPNMFVVESYNGATGQIRLWKLTGGASTPVITSIGYPTSTTHWRGNAGADFGPQSGIPDKIDCGDDRITNLTYRNGKLWCSHNVFLPATGTLNRVSSMWWQIDTLANPIQNGVIDDPTGANFYVYPNLSVNKNDDAIIGFSQLSASSHPNAGYVIRMHTDPVDSIMKPFIYHHGRNTYIQKFSGTKNRWGDYSGSCVDPVNMTDFFTIQETVTINQNSWDTWWAHVTMCAATSAFSVVTHSSNINTNDNFTFTGTAPTGATYAWDFGVGATPATSTSAGPIAVKWSSLGTKTVSLTVTVVGSCSSVVTDTVHVGNYAGVTQVQSKAQELKIVPNPNNGAFDVLFDQPLTGDVTVKLISILGREVYNHQFSVANDNKLAVETQNVPPGVYMANIYTDGNVITQKVTIEK